MRSIKTVSAIFAIALLLMLPAARALDEDWYDKGRRLLDQQQYEKAIKAFSTAIDIIPLDYQSYNYRGVTRALQADFDRAIADYDKAIEIRPRYAEAYNNRGFAHTQTGNLKAALNDYTRALEINPFFVDAYNNKAWILATSSDQRIRDGGQAVRLATKAVELKPDISSMDTLAAAHAATGNFETAVDLQTKAIQILMKENKTAEVPKYMKHLRSYRARQALLVDYSAGPGTAAARKTAKVSLKARTKNAPAASGKEFEMAAAANQPTPPTAKDLERRKFRNANVTGNLYTVQVGEPLPKSKAGKLQARLQASGYFSYSLPAKTDPDRIRVLVGAFEDKQAAADLSKQLQKDGFDPKIVLR